MPKRRNVAEAAASTRYLMPAAQIRVHGIERHAEDFEAEEKRNEVAARGERHRAEHGDQQQNVELFPMFRLSLEVAVGENDYGGRAEQYQPHEKQPIAVNHQQLAGFG